WRREMSSMKRGSARCAKYWRATRSCRLPFCFFFPALTCLLGRASKAALEAESPTSPPECLGPAPCRERSGNQHTSGSPRFIARAPTALAPALLGWPEAHFIPSRARVPRRALVAARRPAARGTIDPRRPHQYRRGAGPGSAGDQRRPTAVGYLDRGRM